MQFLPVKMMATRATDTQRCAASGLRREYLSFWEVVSQSVANVSPSATPALIASLVFASAGNATWLTYAVATLAMLLVTLQVNAFARRSATPGALYTFCLKGLGATWGAAAGWSLILAYLGTASATSVVVSNYTGVLLAHAGITAGGFKIPLMFSAATALSTGWLAYRDVRLSARAMLWLEIISMGLVLILSAAYFVHTRRFIDDEQFELAGASGNGLRLGLVLAIFSFVGFESATSLGEEAKDPLRLIPRATLASVVVSGAFFVLSSYVLVFALRGNSVPLDRQNAPLIALAAAANVPGLGTALIAGAAVSAFACTLASITAAARVIYFMAGHGFFARALGRAHASNATPHIAAATSAAIVLATACIFLLWIPPVNLFGYMGSLATLGFLVSYLILSVAAPVYLYKLGEARWHSWITATLSFGILLLPMIGSVYPLPPPPDAYIPFIFAGLLVPGVVWCGVMARRGAHRQHFLSE